jgi:hypothetical protein
MFALGWVRVANLQAPIAYGQIVAVEAETLGLYRLSSESPVLQGERDSQGKATGVAPHQAGDHKARGVEKDRRLRELPALTKQSNSEQNVQDLSCCSMVSEQQDRGPESVGGTSECNRLRGQGLPESRVQRTVLGTQKGTQPILHELIP